MRDLKKNQQLVYYQNYLGETDVTDSYGYRTGGKMPSYDDMQEAMFCISPNRGTNETEMFGGLVDYDKTMTSADPDVDMNENSILWIDADISSQHNYIVKKKASWKNSVLFAIKEVKVTYAAGNQNLSE